MDSWFSYLSDLIANNRYISVGSFILSIISLLTIFIQVAKRLRNLFAFRSKYLNPHLRNKLGGKRPKGFVQLRLVNKEQQSLQVSEGYDEELLIRKDSELISNKVVNTILNRKKLFSFLPLPLYTLKKKGKTIIFGGPGSGKTTVLLDTYLKLYNPFSWKVLLQNQPKVVLTSMATLSETALTWKKELGLESLDKKVIILIDGLDEFREAHNKSYKQIQEDLKTLLNDVLVDFNNVIITSREIENYERKPGIQHTYLASLKEDDILKIIRKKYVWHIKYFFRTKSRYRLIKERLYERDEYLLKTVCKRPLLLQFVDLVTAEYYVTSKDKLFKSLGGGVHKLEDNGSIFNPNTYYSKEEFTKDLREYLYQNSPIKNFLNFIDKTRLDSIVRDSRVFITNELELFEHILAQLHFREAKKFGVIEAKAQSIYGKVANNVMMRIACQMRLKRQLYLDLESKKESDNALAILKSELTHLSRGELESSLFDDNNEIRINLLTRSVLKFYGTDKIQFLHKSFHDYFVANYIYHNSTRIESMSLILDLQKDSEIWSFYSQFFKITPSKLNLSKTNIDLEDDNLRLITERLIHSPKNIQCNYKDIKIDFLVRPDDSLFNLKKVISIWVVLTNNAFMSQKVLAFGFNKGFGNLTLSFTQVVVDPLGVNLIINKQFDCPNLNFFQFSLVFSDSLFFNKIDDFQEKNQLEKRIEYSILNERNLITFTNNKIKNISHEYAVSILSLWVYLNNFNVQNLLIDRYLIALFKLRPL